MDILRTHLLSKSFDLGGENINILDNISLSVATGEFLVISGSSGSGKTTLLSVLSGLDKPSSGTVVIQDKNISNMSETQLAPFRNQTFGFVFQAFHLVPSLTAIENVAFPAEIAGDHEAYAKASALLERVSMSQRHHSYPYQLSGGEKQRVAICRALINQPNIVFADEPTGNLDSRNGQTILELLIELRQECQSTLILVTHNIEIAQKADRVLVLKDGRLAP
jgi:putative ABC transport system ATP-binding protein